MKKAAKAIFKTSKFDKTNILFNKIFYKQKL